MIIKRVLNNNTIICEENNEEIIIKGKGIAFSKKAGDIVEDAKVEKIFRLETNETIGLYQEVIMNTPEDIILISEKMIDDIKGNTNKKINDKIYVTLTDHISNLLERISMGIVFDSSLLWNVRALYPEEYGLAKSAVSSLSRHLDLKIPSDEANFIAIHIVNSEMNLDLQETVNITRTIDSVMHLITNEFKSLALIEDSLDYARFVLHLRYLLQRIIQNEALNSHKEDNMLKLLFKEYPKQGELVTKIVSILSDKYKKEIDGERLFLMIHVIRLTTN